MLQRTVFFVFVLHVWWGSSGDWLSVGPAMLAAGKLNDHYPLKRYGSSLVILDSDVSLLFGGYMYDHYRRAPVWLNDVWSFSLRSGQWVRRKASGTGPPPVYKHSAVCMERRYVLVFGGDASTNEGGADQYLSSLYVLDTSRWVWVSIQQRNSPPPLQSSSLTRMNSKLLLFGGMTGKNHELAHETNDIFVLDIRSRWYAREGEAHWRKISFTSSERTPVPRRAHSAVAQSHSLLAIFGGFSTQPGAHNFNDVWLFNTTSMKWVLATPLGDIPLSRGGHAAAAAASRGVMFIAHGAHCDLSCQCLSDIWMLDFALNMWKKVQVDSQQDSPVARHFVSFDTLDNGRGLLFFGGESYSPYAYWNDVWILRFDAAYQPEVARVVPKYSAQKILTNNLMVRTNDEIPVYDNSLPMTLFAVAALCLLLFLNRCGLRRNRR